MHLHASASEGAGSIRSQLAQAALQRFDVAWFTDHDWRRHRLLFRQTYSFTANETQFGGTWNVPKLANTGSLATGSGGVLVTTPVSPNDPATGKGSLRLRATSAGTAAASVRNRVNAEGSSRANFRARIAGRTLSVDVLASKSGPDAWGEVFLKLSHHPASGGRPAGIYTLLYRLRSDITATATSSTGLSGVVDVPVTRGAWQTVTLNPTADAAVIWPDLDARDNSMNEIEFHAVSRRRVAAEYFVGYLRLQELSGYDPLGVDAELFSRYASEVPTVQALNGTEISFAQHMNQYGGPQTPFDYGDVTSLRDDLGDLRTAIVQHIHSLGGVASINHPFKPGDGGGNGTQDSVAAGLLAIGAGGADMIETGYASKHGANLMQHIAVWDALSRNGLFLTANGASDDHSGQNWAGQANRFYTAAWAGARDEPVLVDALARGRAYVGLLNSFGGTIDMTIDGTVPMGAVAVEAPRTPHAAARGHRRTDRRGRAVGPRRRRLRGARHTAAEHRGLRHPDPRRARSRTPRSPSRRTTTASCGPRSSPRPVRWWASASRSGCSRPSRPPASRIGAAHRPDMRPGISLRSPTGSSDYLTCQAKRV